MVIGTGTALAIGGVAGLAGSALQADATSDAAAAAANAAAFRPYDVGGGGLGFVDFDQPNLTVTAQQDPTLSSIQNLLGMRTLGALTGPQSDLLTGATGAAGRRIGSLFEGQLDASRQSELMQRMALGGLQTRGRTFDREQGMLMRGVAGQRGAAGITDPAAMFAMQQGAGLLGQDFRGTIDSTLQNLRASARPQEERAVNQRVQDLFSRGTLGSTSGARALGELAQAQEQADIQRQIQAEQLGLQQFGAAQQAGQGLLFGGAGEMRAGAGLNLQRAQQMGALGLQGLGARRDFAGNLFEAGMAGADLTNRRAAERMAAAQSLFGFGQQARAEDMNLVTGGVNAQLAMNQDLRNLIALGGNIGGQQASAGAAQAQAIMSGAGSPLGAGLAGFGTGLFDAALGSMF